MANHSLTLSHQFAKPAEELYKAWTEPTLMEQWFYPGEGWTADSTNELKRGGTYQHMMRDSEGKEYAHRGEYKELVPNKRIVFTWNSSVVEDTLVSIELKTIGDKTELTLTHEFFPDEEAVHCHTEGWHGCITNLERLYAHS